MDKPYKVFARFRSGSVVSNVVHASCEIEACDLYKRTLTQLLGIVPIEVTASVSKTYLVAFGPFTYEVTAYSLEEAIGIGKDIFRSSYYHEPPTVEVFEIKHKELIAA